jgi:predicted RNA-binding protein with PIN domain
MPLLVDGHNLIGQMPDLHLCDPDDEIGLVRKLRAYASRTGKRITVVFDSGLPGGRSAELSGAGVEAVFASHHSSADRVLLERVETASDRGGLTVVTSDREVAERVRLYGARVVSSGQFANHLDARRDPVEARDVSPSSEEVEEWLEVFLHRDDH